MLSQLQLVDIANLEVKLDALQKRLRDLRETRAVMEDVYSAVSTGNTNSGLLGGLLQTATFAAGVYTQYEVGEKVLSTQADIAKTKEKLATIRAALNTSHAVEANASVGHAEPPEVFSEVIVVVFAVLILSSRARVCKCRPPPRLPKQW